MHVCVHPVSIFNLPNKHTHTQVVTSIVYVEDRKNVCYSFSVFGHGMFPWLLEETQGKNRHLLPWILHFFIIFLNTHEPHQPLQCINYHVYCSKGATEISEKEECDECNLQNFNRKCLKQINLHLNLDLHQNKPAQQV